MLRIDRAHPRAFNALDPPSPTADFLTRHKSSIAVNWKSAGGLDVLLSILKHADVLIDPFRPGVLEKMGLSPSTLLALNPRLVITRLTGFRRDGKYAAMAGHDINYLAVSGVLSQLGRRGAPPAFPANLLGDFAAGGLMAAFGVVLALLARERSGKGQVVGANMVDGAAYIGTFLRLTRKTPGQAGPRGENLLDGGSPYYEVYETGDGGYMAVGALEPQFFALLVEGLGIDEAWNERRYDRDEWAELRDLLTRRFKAKTRAEWEKVFDGKDACCTPVLEQAELEEAGYEQRAAVGLSATPSRPIDQHAAYNPVGIPPGHNGRELLKEWLGWQEGKQFVVENGGLVKKSESKL